MNHAENAPPIGEIAKEKGFLTGKEFQSPYFLPDKPYQSAVQVSP